MYRIRLFRLVLVTASAAFLASTACSPGHEKPTTSQGVAATPSTLSPENDPSTTVTTALTRASLVLSADGLGPLSFGTQAAHALSGLTKALGQAEKITPVPAGSGCAATRRFQWANLQVFVNEVSGTSATRPGLVGWYLGAAKPAPVDLKTDKGIGVGSTVAVVQAAYGHDVAVAQGAQGPGFTITGAAGAVTGRLDGLAAANKVTSLEAGAVCGL